jgi:uncharacterized protein (DUF4415 family)
VVVYSETSRGIRVIRFRKANFREQSAMSKKPDPEMTDADNPAWTEAMFKQAVHVDDLSDSLGDKLRRSPRGPQKAPRKISTTIRLSPEVVTAFRAAGDGWQTRIDQALKAWLKMHPQS